MYGKIIAYSPKTERGIIECNFDGATLRFFAKDVLGEDRHYLKDGVNVEFGIDNCMYAVNIELVSGSYKRFNASVRAERTAKTIELDITKVRE